VGPGTIAAESKARNGRSLIVGLLGGPDPKITGVFLGHGGRGWKQVVRHELSMKDTHGLKQIPCKTIQLAPSCFAEHMRNGKAA
jgi:hypothetical protein